MARSVALNLARSLALTLALKVGFELEQRIKLAKRVSPKCLFGIGKRFRFRSARSVGFSWSEVYVGDFRAVYVYNWREGFN